MIMAVKLSTIKPNPNNPRIIKDEKFEKLKKSIKNFPKMMELRPMVINKDNIVLGGNMRLKALKELGYKEVPDEWVKQAEDLTEDEQRQFIIKDNVGFGEHDWEMLATEWDAEELSDWGLDMPADWGQEEVLEAEEDDFDTTPPEEPKTVLGDLYEIVEHRLVCGDSTDSDQVAKLIGNNKIDFIWTDPPYGINEKGDRSKRGGLAKGNNLPDFKDDTIQYAIDAFNQPFNVDVKNQVWFGANYYCHSLPQTANWLVWDKRVEDNQRDNNSDCELAWIKSNFSSIRIFRHLWKGMLKDSERGEKRVHATQKPIALVEFCINEYNKDCKTILDYFGGSGVCMVASHQLKKQNLTMEFEPHNCDVIVKRMINLDPTLTIKRNGKDVTNEWK